MFVKYKSSRTGRLPAGEIDFSRPSGLYKVFTLFEYRESLALLWLEQAARYLNGSLEVCYSPATVQFDPDCENWVAIIYVATYILRPTIATRPRVHRAAPVASNDTIARP
jgi:hypothetical protein